MGLLNIQSSSISPFFRCRLRKSSAFSFPLLFLVLDALLSQVHLDSVASEVDKYLEMGRKMMAAGQLADALTHYHAAIDHDPANYMTYFKRATVFLAMGRSKSALPDLDKVITMKPDFVSARLQRGNIHLKQGTFEDARRDFEDVLQLAPNNEEAIIKLAEVQPLEQALVDAEKLLRYHDFHGAIERLSTLIEKLPWDVRLRELRADAYHHLGEVFKAISDLRAVTKLRPDSRKTHLQISLLHYSSGENEESLTEIRECLKLDPDDSDCKPHYNKVKKLTKQYGAISSAISEQRWNDCRLKAEAAKKTETREWRYLVKTNRLLCHCLRHEGLAKEAVGACDEALRHDPDSFDALMDRGEAKLLMEKYDDAVDDFQKAKNVDQESRKAQDALERAQRLLKQSQKRDYYKILGVKRNARKKEILKAYKTLAKQWHPDMFKDEKEKAEAQKKFIEIAAAKEVLTDEEKRQQYDNGQDPLDPESQQGGGGGGGRGFNPFGESFNPFGDGAQFEFHF